MSRSSCIFWQRSPDDRGAWLSLFATDLEDLNLAVVELSGGVSAFIYHNWLFPENTAKLTVIGSKKMLVYEGKFEKRAITVYEYDVDRAGNAQSGTHDLPTTIPSKILTEHTFLV